MAEFWNACTRPKERNGFGWTIEETERNAQAIERSFVFLVDNEAVYREWRRIIVRAGAPRSQKRDLGHPLNDHPRRFSSLPAAP